LLIRKGGIRENANRFEVRHQEFLLFPSFEHQQASLLKPEHAEGMAGALQEHADPDWLIFTHFAQVHRAFPVSELTELQALSPHHIWSDDYAKARLRWKPQQTLTAMVLKTFRLNKPVIVPMRPEYVGCKSWLDLTEAMEMGSMNAVLSEETFAERANAIDRAMASSVPMLL
jgi:hypothetical protein